MNGPVRACASGTSSLVSASWSRRWCGGCIEHKAGPLCGSPGLARGGCNPRVVIRDVRAPRGWMGQTGAGALPSRRTSHPATQLFAYREG